MRVLVHAGTALDVIGALHRALSQARAATQAAGVLAPDGVSGTVPGDLVAAALPLSEPHPHAALLGLGDPVDHQDHALLSKMCLGRVIATHRPRVLVLSLPAAAVWLDDATRLSGLARLLADFADDVRVVLHMAHPAEALADLFAAQVAAGRTTGLTDEIRVAADPAGWWQAATALRAGLRMPEHPSRHPAAQTPMPAVDGAGTAALWAQVFGADVVTARELPPGPAGPEALAEVLGDLALPLDLTVDAAPSRRPSVAALGRLLRTNRALAEVEAEGGPIPAHLRNQVLLRLDDKAPGLEAADLGTLTQALRPLSGARPLPDIAPDTGFDPAPLLADLPQHLAKWREEMAAIRRARTPAAATTAPTGRSAPEPLSPAAQTMLGDQAREILRTFAGGRFWPHNNVTTFDEAADLPSFSAEPGPPTGTLIIACMKNEGPYILEWVAYHKAIGIDHFLIFTNDCSDGTNEILDRLAELGHLTRESNDEWKGASPQQAALNRAIKMDVAKRADWLIHIDIDEYINIRMGDGTMADLLAAMGPDATNLAMTWRLFGNAGVEDIGDGSVIDRFTGCSPTWCPKPHTIWGFKSMTRNGGAYKKLSCHRPNQLNASVPVKWLNGSLKDATKELAEKGWRNSTSSIGFDAVQLNHYALRSRESFLIKRQRGRALHVDRSIGLNYWVRHDWSRNIDRTILRQVPRMQAMKAALLADPVLARWHEESLAWHRAKAEDLRGIDAFRELWDQTRTADLTDPERMAYAVAEDMES
jgi:hypothetical protein